MWYCLGQWDGNRSHCVRLLGKLVFMGHWEEGNAADMHLLVFCLLISSFLKHGHDTWRTGDHLVTMKTKVTQGQSSRLKGLLVFCDIFEQLYQPNLDYFSMEFMFQEKNKSIFLNRALDKLHIINLDSLVEIFKIHMVKTTNIINPKNYISINHAEV